MVHPDLLATQEVPEIRGTRVSRAQMGLLVLREKGDDLEQLARGDRLVQGVSVANGAAEEVKVSLGLKVIRVNQAHLVQLGSLVLMVQRVSGVTQASKESLELLERMESQDHLEKEVPQE